LRVSSVHLRRLENRTPDAVNRHRSRNEAPLLRQLCGKLAARPAPLGGQRLPRAAV